VAAEVCADAEEGLARAEDGVGGSGVSDALAAHRILLVVEREGGSCERVDVQVIQRGVQGGGLGLADGEGDVAEAEGGGAGFPGAEEVLGGA
jgi:hypothetical protein